MRRIAVIDNSTLVNLTGLHHLKIFSLLRNIFSSIHIPTKVLEEYGKMSTHDPIRATIVSQLQPNYGFLSLCTKYDTISYSILSTQPGIDAGEAEAAAQLKSIFAHYVSQMTNDSSKQ